jgi:hypothetical protein
VVVKIHYGHDQHSTKENLDLWMLGIGCNKAQDAGMNETPTAILNGGAGIHMPVYGDRIVYRQHVVRRTVDILIMHRVIPHKSHNAWVSGGSQLGTQGKWPFIAYCIMHRVFASLCIMR